MLNNKFSLNALSSKSRKSSDSFAVFSLLLDNNHFFWITLFHIDFDKNFSNIALKSSKVIICTLFKFFFLNCLK